MVSLTAVMEAKQGCKVHTCDTLNAFTQTKLDDVKERIILIFLATESLCEIAPVHKPFLEKERGQSVSHLECTNVTHGILFYKLFKNDMEAIDFEINLHD